MLDSLLKTLSNFDDLVLSEFCLSFDSVIDFFFWGGGGFSEDRRECHTPTEKRGEDRSYEVRNPQ